MLDHYQTTRAHDVGCSFLVRYFEVHRKDPWHAKDMQAGSKAGSSNEQWVALDTEWGVFQD
jgi:hypothetical protein